LIKILLLTFVLIKLDLRAIDKERKEEARAINLIFRLIIVNYIEFTIDNVYYNKDCTCDN